MSCVPHKSKELQNKSPARLEAEYKNKPPIATVCLIVDPSCLIKQNKKEAK